MTASMLPRLNRTIDAMFNDLWRPPALAVGWCTAAGLTGHRCLGERKLGSGAVVNTHTLFALASGTKTLAVASIAHLCDRGVLDWDTRVVELDPAFDAGDPTVTAQLTLRDLACHRTGWTSSEGRHRAAATSRADLVARLRYHGFRHEFRERFAYCTDGFSVLGHAVDVATGTAWEQYARTGLLTPLAMSRTVFSVAEVHAAGNFATPHVSLADGQRVAIPWQYEDGVATPAGGANSCIADLAQWLGAWLAPDASNVPWSAQQRELMLTAQIADAGPFADAEFTCAVATGPDGITDEAYALGWYCHRYRGELVYHHTGSIRGFRSIIGLLPERGLGFIALANADTVFLPRALLQAAIDELQGSDPGRWTERFFELETARHESESQRYRYDDRQITAQLGTLADLQGEYQDDGRYGLIRIARRDGELMFEAGPLHCPLRPAGTDALVCEEQCGPLLVDRGPLQVQRDARSHAVVGFDFQGSRFRRIRD